MSNQKRGTIMMIFCSLMWSTGGVLMKFLPLNPLVIASTRSLVAAMVIYIFMVTTKISLKFDKLAITAGVMYGINTACYVIANKMTTAANAIVIQSANPIFIIILAALLFKQKPRKIDIMVVVLCIIGVALFFFDDLSPGSMTGNIVALCSGLFVALAYTVSSKAPNQSSTMTGILLGHIFTLLIGMPALFTARTDWKINYILIIIFLGIFQLGIPFVLFSIAIRNCPALTCSLVGMIEPIASPIWVAMIIGEVPGLLALLGGFIVIATITMWSMNNAKIQTTNL